MLVGPFRGMKTPIVFQSEYRLGTYEKELYPYIERICTQSFGMILNIGAEKGYYAAGLAFRNRNTFVTAFEENEILHPIIEETVKMNKVEGRVAIQGRCTTDILNQALLPNKKYLIMMDCEGEEANLLAPFVVPKLRECTILVELHDYKIPNVGDIIRGRFEETHAISEIWATKRGIKDFPSYIPLLFRIPPFRKHILRSVNKERQEKMRWFYMEPK